MAKLVSVAEMVAIERAADAAGLSYARMMENAGHSLAELIHAHSLGFETSALGLVGKGNNGGDTLVALAELAEMGWRVSAYLVGERSREDAYLQRLVGRGGIVVDASQDTNFDDLAQLIGEHALLLDGLLGTGIRLPLRPPISSVLEAVHEAIQWAPLPPLVVAVDCPSGMDCESGEVAPETLPAEQTVCMAAVKRGMLSLPAYDFLGELVVADIGLPDELAEWAAICLHAVDMVMVQAVLPERHSDSHKGSYGTALLVGGSRNYPGAMLLAGRAAARSGAGLVALGVPASLQFSLAGHIPEAIWQPLDEEDGGIAAVAVAQLGHGLERATAILLGPGFGLGAGRRAFIDNLLDQQLPAMVVDADALKLLAEIDNWPQRLPELSILTPHPGEMSILCGLEARTIQADRLAVAERFAAEWKHILVLKGAFTVVAAPDGRTAVNPIASSALATAGTGDVLAGLITGLRAQGMEAFEAAYAGAYLHALAGQRAAERLGGEAGVIAPDIIDELPQLIG
jgi:NAD(P)H-hydrate epimerase